MILLCSILVKCKTKTKLGLRCEYIDPSDDTTLTVYGTIAEVPSVIVKWGSQIARRTRLGIAFGIKLIGDNGSGLSDVDGDTRGMTNGASSMQDSSSGNVGERVSGKGLMSLSGDQTLKAELGVRQ